MGVMEFYKKYESQPGEINPYLLEKKNKNEVVYPSSKYINIRIHGSKIYCSFSNLSL